MHSPHLLWAAPFCIHDSSSGAALQLKNMFEKLVERGVKCHVLGALTFDSLSGTAPFPNFEEQLKQEQTWLGLEGAGVTYQYQKTASRFVDHMTRAEESLFLSRFLETLVEFPPDAVIHFGGSALEMAIRSICKRKNIPVILCVSNGGYLNYSFPDIDLVITDSESQTRFYYTNGKGRLTATGTFIRPEMVVAPKRDPKYITFINPHPTKGVSIVLQMVRMARTQLPKEKFLIVQSRGNWFEVLQHYKMQDEDFSHVDVAEHCTDVRPIYAATKVLLAPSLWYEGFGRVAAEATMNGIPVIASTSGGLPEAVNGGGVNISAPQACHDDHLRLPTEEEVQPWMDALKDMVASKRKYNEWSQKALESSKIHEIESVTDRTMDILAPIFARRASQNPHIFL